MIMKYNYETPQICVVITAPESLLCGSPSPGAIEDVYYENWTN